MRGYHAVMSTHFQSFAIVPAAGRSVRMGTAKLLLPWQGRPLIAHVIAAWRQSRVGRIAVVARRDDQPLIAYLQGEDVDLVLPPTPPPQMKDSVQAALVHLADRYAPVANAAWLLAPADLPQLNPRVINHVLSAVPTRVDSIIVPSFQGQRGHPVRFPWSLHAAVLGLGPDQGVNALLKQYPVQEVETNLPGEEMDIDRPEDYRRLQAQQREVDANAAGVPPERPGKTAE